MKQQLKRYLNAQKASDRAFQKYLDFCTQHDDLREIIESGINTDIINEYCDLRSNAIESDLRAMREHRSVNALIYSIIKEDEPNDMEVLLLSLRYIHGMRVDQICYELQCSQRLIYRVLHHAFELLDA